MREIAILPQFLAIEPHFARKGSPDALQIAILLQFLAIKPHFMLRPDPCNRNFTFFGDRTSFRAKGLRSDNCKSKSQFYLSFWRSNLISCERVATGREKWQFYLSFWRLNLISCDRVALGQV